MLGRCAERTFKRDFTIAASRLNFAVVLQTLLFQVGLAAMYIWLVPGSAEMVAIGFAMLATLYTLVVEERFVYGWIVLISNVTMALLFNYRYYVALVLWLATVACTYRRLY
tara:strand:- start:7235 stop:7567 length:333 start_codon:yes stop_codon:yes gene_type:complete